MSANKKKLLIFYFPQNENHNHEQSYLEVIRSMFQECSSIGELKDVERDQEKCLET